MATAVRASISKPHLRVLDQFPFVRVRIQANIFPISLMNTKRCISHDQNPSSRGYSSRAPVYTDYTQAEPVAGTAKSGSLWSSATAFLKLLGRDFRMLLLFGRVQRGISRHRNDSVASAFHKVVLRQPDKLAIIGEDSQLTFQQLEDYANKVANIFSRQSGLQRHDTIALFGTSSAEYVGLWLGLSKLQMRAALLNNNLLGDVLMHSIKSVNAKAFLVDTELLSQFESVRKDLLDKPIFYYNSNPKATRPPEVPADKWLNSLLTQASSEAPPKIEANPDDVLLYIYTSGTTGLPKGAIITQLRFLSYTSIFQNCVSLRTDDVIYCTLPLYHASAGTATIGQVLLNGATAVVRNKFSAKQFWDDVVKYRCTAMTYIGEICRFLLAQHPNDLENKHSLRVAYGQGLRPALWGEFVRRFNVRDIRETYGSTEGSAGMANYFGKPGAVGYFGALAGKLNLVAIPVIVPINQETGEIVRTASGFSRVARPGEEGEMMGPITMDKLRRFDGYTDSKAAAGKIVENILKKGDKYFRTGDIMVQDEEGFIYFVDRIGDSFRWKGENVSTTEVEGIISKLWKYADVSVYGVDVPGCEGKAGMLCVAARDDAWDVSRIYEQLAAHLPSYAIPLFIRFSDALDLTGTFKIPKTRLKKEGFNPDRTDGDKIYYLDYETKRHKPLTREVFEQISKGNIKF